MDAPSTSGYLCHLCQWRSRSESRELMDEKTLMAHGQRYHYLQSSQLHDYVQGATCVDRDPSRNQASQSNHPPQSLQTSGSNFKSPNMWHEMAATLPRSLPAPTDDPQSIELWQRMVEFQYYGHHLQNFIGMPTPSYTEPSLSEEQFSWVEASNLNHQFPEEELGLSDLNELPPIPDSGWMADSISMTDFDYELSQNPTFFEQPQQDMQKQVQSTNHSPVHLLFPTSRSEGIGDEESFINDHFTNMLMDGSNWNDIDYSYTSFLVGTGEAEAGEAGELMDLYDAGRYSSRDE